MRRPFHNAAYTDYFVLPAFQQRVVLDADARSLLLGPNLLEPKLVDRNTGRIVDVFRD
jgi:hypothetical protein